MKETRLETGRVYIGLSYKVGLDLHGLDLIGADVVASCGDN